MKGILSVFLALTVLLYCGCSGIGNIGQTQMFYCTQDGVCDERIDPDKYAFFHYAADSGIVIPGLRQNFVPQGIGYWEEKDWLMLSGYFIPVSGTSAASLLAVDRKTGQLAGEYTLVDRSGREFGGHFSGIAVTASDLYVTGPYCLYRVPLRNVYQAGNQGALTVAQKIPLSVAADSCNYSRETLWVCEYYQPQAYPLKGEHMTVCNSGETHYAWMAGYHISPQGELKPKCVLTVPDRVQGITVLPDGRVLLSQSYGRRNASRLLLCQDPRRNAADQYVELDGTRVPLWHLDSANGVEYISAPPMAEGCCAVGDVVYLIFESAAYYYRAFTPENPALDPTDKIWAFLPSKKD